MEPVWEFLGKKKDAGGVLPFVYFSLKHWITNNRVNKVQKFGFFYEVKIHIFISRRFEQEFPLINSFFLSSLN